MPMQTRISDVCRIAYSGSSTKSPNKRLLDRYDDGSDKKNSSKSQPSFDQILKEKFKTGA